MVVFPRSSLRLKLLSAAALVPAFLAALGLKVRGALGGDWRGWALGLH